MKMRVAPLAAQFKEGIYRAVVESLEPQNGAYGDYIKWSFLVPTAKGEAVTVTGLTSTVFTPHPRCKLYAWASAVKGRPFEINEILDTDTLINQQCRVYVIIRELETGGSVNQVEKVLPPEEPVTNSNQPDDDRNPFDDDDSDLPF
jgi:hypothetical protein